ncbi:peptidase inhibitor family I36 protein [Polyangium jinanense]|uniref:Peptidase inhibitor family I36 protein n=1 Tax=Polyangium jinanense TaxID=2829994 RepID=A0A9X3XEC1_9BACT|nr:peptidase inhibitor family I36 protein [Polyangium jinanense]MDC3962933.1 peptidase inhibitor family I36 protein [Polyangium jinanense]MDC3989064.1 peptidase inhibitor family I36 protein [Polyangium jinanense]
MIKSMIVGLFALGAVCVASHADACAVFFEKPNYEGRSYSADAGSSVPRIGNGWNDTISSIKVASHCTVAVYEDPNFGGEPLTLSDDASTLGIWDDKISSFYCACWY